MTMRNHRDRSTRRVEQDLYCSWGRHYTTRLPHIMETFDKGTICLICQLEIVTALTDRVDFPELRHFLTDKEVTRDLAEKQRARTIRRIDPTKQGFVYYMRMNGQIKIGFATDVTKRMRAYPPETELLAVEPGDMSVERDRHVEFRGELVRGREWFRETARLSRLIESLRATHGDPASLAYEYTRHAEGA